MLRESPSRKPEVNETPDQPVGESKFEEKENLSSNDQASFPSLDPTRYGDWVKKGRCIDF